MTSPTTPESDNLRSQSEVNAWAEHELAHIESLPAVQAAKQWLRDHAAEFVSNQIAVTNIPAPPFGERPRAEWLLDRFQELNLTETHLDGIGNAIGVYGHAGESPCVAVTAHLDTVFPSGTPVNVREANGRLYAPGVSDNSAGITALLAVAGALRSAGLRTNMPIAFIGNVGEEGEGDIRGMRYLFANPRWRDAIAYTLVLDGAGTDTIVTEALGSRRFQVTLRGSGGHSWSDFGVPNPVVVLARAIEMFARTPLPASPKTTFNIGLIEGGTSVNAIPQSASMKVDIRSVAAEQIDRLEKALRESVDQAMAVEPRHAFGGKTHSGLAADVNVIGDRPAAQLNPDSRMLAVLRAVDRYLENASRVQRASTDANIPLSMGKEAIAIGAGGTGGGAHTLQEWHDPTQRELGLHRILLTVLALAGAQE